MASKKKTLLFKQVWPLVVLTREISGVDTGGPPGKVGTGERDKGCKAGRAFREFLHLWRQ